MGRAVGLIWISTPRLPFSCSGGSFIVNEDYDLVLQRERMTGIVAAYLTGLPADDAQVSPLLGPPEALGGLPPTLVHVGDSEVLLDDARSFAELARLHGSDVTLREWTGVVHAWHSFFSIMPKADDAVLEVVAFLRQHLT